MQKKRGSRIAENRFERSLNLSRLKTWSTYEIIGMKCAIAQGTTANFKVTQVVNKKRASISPVSLSPSSWATTWGQIAIKYCNSQLPNQSKISEEVKCDVTTIGARTTGTAWKPAISWTAQREKEVAGRRSSPPGARRDLPVGWRTIADGTTSHSPQCQPRRVGRQRGQLEERRTRVAV